MPIYDYLCPTCKTTEEVFAKSSEDVHTCPSCGTRMERKLSSPCFVLKGGGWSSPGSFSKSKDGPKLDKELLSLSDRDLNMELGLPPDLP